MTEGTNGLLAKNASSAERKEAGTGPVMGGGTIPLAPVGLSSPTTANCAARDILGSLPVINGVRVIKFWRNQRK